jgi:hydroxypyruvate isomerase
VQAGGFPDPMASSTGELNFARTLAALDAIGYQGAIGIDAFDPRAQLVQRPIA